MSDFCGSCGMADCQCYTATELADFDLESEMSLKAWNTYVNLRAKYTSLRTERDDYLDGENEALGKCLEFQQRIAELRRYKAALDVIARNILLGGYAHLEPGAMKVDGSKERGVGATVIFFDDDDKLVNRVEAPTLLEAVEKAGE